MSNVFDVIAMDKDFGIVSLLAYTNLQWKRKYYESGTFSIQIPASQYDSSFKYIYTKDRPEVGEITQINFSVINGANYIQLSGYFLEEEVNRRVVYEKSTTTNITNEPSWAEQTGTAEDVAMTFFNAFKDVTYTQDSVSKTSTLGIASATSQSRGNAADHVRDGSKLGSKMYAILKPSGMSYRINYDYLTSTKTLECWKGVDRTQDNTESNNPIIFSTEYGNIKNPNVVWSNSEYKNCYIAKATASADDTDETYIEAIGETATDDLFDSFVEVVSSVNKSDYDTTADYIAAIIADGHEQLLEHPITLSFDLDAVLGSYEYMTDFDLGDKCSINIPEAGISADAYLVGCSEVIKSGTWTLTMEFDI